MNSGNGDILRQINPAQNRDGLIQTEESGVGTRLIKGILMGVGIIILGMLGTPDGRIYIQINQEGKTNMRSTNTTIFDFYQGAYGPTIRIDIQDFEWLKWFESVVKDLMAYEREEEQSDF